jgi:hypothetical protein
MEEEDRRFVIFVVGLEGQADVGAATNVGTDC